MAAGSCTRDALGTFQLSAEEVVDLPSAVKACLRRCFGCANCHTVTLNQKMRDCSWYSVCNLQHLKTHWKGFLSAAVPWSNASSTSGAKFERPGEHDECLKWGGTQWVTSSGIQVPRFSKHDFRHSNRTLLVVGDSSMRFLYSAILDAFGLHDRPYPFHWLPDDDPCSFAQVGWPQSGPCADKWRGPCRDAADGCTYEHTWHGIRLIFTWWHDKLPLTLPIKDNVHLLVTSTGIWEMFGDDGSLNTRHTYRSAVRQNLQSIVHAVQPKFTVAFSNGICLGAQQTFFPTVHAAREPFPSVGFELQLLSGNRELQQLTEGNAGMAYYDRSMSMLTGNDVSSPCFHHHPYGKASDLHAAIALSHLLP